MKFLLLLTLSQLLFSIFAQPNAEFYTLDGRRADPCVNLQKLGPYRPDCTPNSMQPAISTTYYIPTISPTNFAAALTIAGSFFTSGPTSSLALAPIGSPDSCAVIDTTIPAITATHTGTTQLTFAPSNLQASWIQRPATLANPITAPQETYPRALCWSLDGISWQWTGFHLAVVFACDLATDPTSATLCKNKGQIFNAPSQTAQAAIYNSQLSCCPVGTVQTSYRVGQCMNSNFQTCCGSLPITSQMKCCNESVETVAWADGTCPCRNLKDAGGNPINQCPYGELCCLPSKFSELNITSATDVNKVGDCFNPRTHRCCNTGFKYDPGSEQCCSINGLQSLNAPCPCSQDSHCQIAGQAVNGDVNQGYRMQDMMCCIQTAPAIYETTSYAGACNGYANFPTGQGHYSIQQCIGQCIDTKYQICCNGRACIKQYERCCNTTCCNRYNGTCQTGTLRAGSSRQNYLEVLVNYDVCTNVEQIDLIRAWWMFVLPTFFLIATLLSLAMALVFAGRVEHSARRALENGIIISAIISVMFATCTFFAPIYKYGAVIVLISLFAVLTAAARRPGMYIANIVLQVFLIIYLIDPFHGNDYFNLAVDRNAYGRTDPYAAGLWHATTRIWDVPTSCWDFYSGYFRFDPLIRDNVRVDQPSNPSFGYCSRGWVSALLVFDGFIIISVIIQFLLSVIALLSRTRKTVS